MRKALIAAVLTMLMFPWSSSYAEDGDNGDVFLDFIRSIKPSFFIDMAYNYNFNDPDSGINSLRIFDVDNNEFNLHLVEIAFERTPTTDGGFADLVGFRVDLAFGEDAEIFASSGLGDSDDEFDLQQAYIHVLVPVGTGLHVYAGKFVTLAGYEVIESFGNPNYSRSFLFGFALPFTHTGVRASYAAGPLGITLGLNNGYDVVDDPNDGKTIESQLALTLENASLYLTGYFGPESENDWRELITLVGVVTLLEKLTFVVDAAFGWEQDVDFDLDGDGVTDIEEDVNWWGVAGYVIYDLNEIIRLALRGEFFVDDDGARTGIEQELFEITPTLSIKPFAGKKGLDNFVIRFEYRFDHSDEDSFEDDDGDFKDTQHTVATELLYYFSL